MIKSDTTDTTDTKKKVAIDFAVKHAKNSHSSSEKDFKTSQELAFDDEEIMEIIAMSDIAIFYNHLANATIINIDKGFSKIISRRTTEKNNADFIPESL